MSSERTAPVGSRRWQPGAIADDLSELGGYLERVSQTDLIQKVADSAMQLLALKSGDRVLELGCGNGTFLPRLATAVGSSGQVLGVDHSQEFIELARRRVNSAGLDRVQLEVADAYQLPFEDASFDAAHCERVLMHLADPTAALRELARVVRPGGRIVAAEPDRGGLLIDHPDPEALEWAFARMRRRLKNGNVGLTLRRRMVEAGLTRVTTQPVLNHVLELETLVRFGIDLSVPAEELLAEGNLPPERLRAVVPTLQQACDAGAFYATGVFHVAGGTVPLATHTNT